MKPTVGVIGLGIMGGAMAEALLKAGYKVCGYDVRPEACRRLKRAGGRPLASGAAVARGCGRADHFAGHGARARRGGGGARGGKSRRASRS